MCNVSLFESEELVKRLNPLDLTQAGKRSWIDQVTVAVNEFILQNISLLKCYFHLTQAGKRSWIDQVTVVRVIYQILLGCEILENVPIFILQNISLLSCYLLSKSIRKCNGDV